MLEATTEPAFSAVDQELARTLGRLSGETDPRVLLAVSQTSRALRNGHVCIPLDELADGASVTALETTLRASRLVSGDTAAPLVLEAGRLYLRRYWQHERELAERLRARIDEADVAIEGALLRDGLARLFPRTGLAAGEVDRQRLAALVATMRRFCVISGGPGTGKTSTVVKILALLVEQARHAGKRRFGIMLVAPTGKAAARLGEAIRGERSQLACAESIRAAIPDEAMTIHRCLRPLPGSTTRFRHDADNPIAADVVLVDEASMVDLALMNRLVGALPPSARLILLGDRNQLASVEAGAIFGDICRAADGKGFSGTFVSQAHSRVGETLPTSAAAPAGSGIWDCIVELERSWRYGETSGIAYVARAVHRGDTEGAVELLRSGSRPDAVLAPPIGKVATERLERQVIAGYGPYLNETAPALAFDAFNRFRILTAHRRGPFGVGALNLHAERALDEAGLLRPRGHWYVHRPVIVGENDYQLRLFNGDVGLALPDANGSMRVHFVSPGDASRVLAPSRLPAHETVFAMTVHRAQGSEVDEVALVLPAEASRALSRELVYTAITRAKHRVTIHASPEVLAAALASTVRRASGLAARLSRV
jgi:exodeoxyribonuclease V alpha subunit